MRWAYLVAFTREMMRHYKVFVGKPEGKDQLGDLYIDGRAVLRADFKGEKCGLESLAENNDQ
jgi:hypothetical protein